MVVKKKLDRRVDNSQVAFVPKGPRSARRSPFKKAAKHPQNCAFELLASLAGRLLQEGESSSASSNACEAKDWSTFSKGNCRQEGLEEDRPLKIESICQVSYDDITSKSEVVSQHLSEKCFQHCEGNVVSKDEPVINSSNSLVKVGADGKFVNCQTDKSSGDFYGRVTDASLIGESSGVNIEKKFLHQEEAGRFLSGKLTAVDKGTLKDTMKLCDKSSLMINSDSDMKAPYSLEAIPSISNRRRGNSVKLGCRDDDEKFSSFNRSNTIRRAYRPPQRIACRRIRKLLTSKYWKLAPKSKDYELSRSDMGVKPLYRKRKVSYSFEGFHHNSVFKRMKVSEQSSVVNPDGGFSSDSVSNSLEKGTSGVKNGVTAPSSSVHGHQASFHSKSSHVKLSIKSFRVPELYVEVPETATVGSLKRTVMEAVMAILGGGLRVGLLVQGKKIRDDHKTLRQIDIACKENLDSLGFTLEPSSVPASHPVSSVDPTPLLSSETSQLIIRSPGTTVLESGITDCTTDSSLLTNTSNIVENHQSPLSQTDATFDKKDPDSRALVIVPETNSESLALVPVSQKTKRSEFVQRRTRRPFSVSEVEELVQAVEELGTGRWRDVKLRAFESAGHRTYVDLKDKWKTLVHTAKISPQQRRGEPVPQELLNRVLAAHAYWSQHQARQNGKHQNGTLKIADSTTEGTGGSIQQEAV